MQVSKIVAIAVKKSVGTNLNSADENTKLDLICCELAKIFGDRKASIMLTVDRDILSDCLNELAHV